MARYPDKTRVDFVVVGGGGAGAIVAKELSAAGFQVVILEQGPYLHEGDFEHDELKFKNIYVSPAIGHEVLTNDHASRPIRSASRKTRRRLLLRTSNMDGVLEAVRSTSPPTIGAFMRSIFTSSALGENCPAQGLPTGQLAMPSSNRITRRLNGN